MVPLIIRCNINTRTSLLSLIDFFVVESAVQGRADASLTRCLFFAVYNVVYRRITCFQCEDLNPAKMFS